MDNPLINLSTLKKYSQNHGWFRDKKLVYHGLGPVGAHMFQHFMPITAIIALYHGEEVEKYIEREWGTRVFSYERIHGVRVNDSTHFHRHFFHEHGEEVAAYLNALEGELCLAPFAPSPAIHEFVFRKLGNCRLMQNPKIVQNYFEYKARLAWEADSIGIPMPPASRVHCFGELSFSPLIDAFPDGFVLQIPLSAGGTGTDFAFCEEDFDRIVEIKKKELDAAFSTTEVKITPFLSGPNPNCTGCVVNGAVALSQPGIQIAGDPYFVKRPGQYIGSDYTVKAFTEEQREYILDITRRIGEWLGCNGFRGNFGVDFLSTVDEAHRIRDIHVSEVNGRLVGESQYLADFQAMKECVPLTFFHLAEWFRIGEITASMVKEYNSSLPEIEGSALILYTRDKGTFTAEGGITSGVYRCENGALSRLRDGYLLSQTEHPDEFVISVGVPWKGLVLGHPVMGDHNIYICYLFTRESIVDPQNYRLINAKWRRIADTVYDALNLTPCEPRLIGSER